MSALPFGHKRLLEALPHGFEFVRRWCGQYGRVQSFVSYRRNKPTMYRMEVHLKCGQTAQFVIVGDELLIYNLTPTPKED